MIVRASAITRGAPPTFRARHRAAPTDAPSLHRHRCPPSLCRSAAPRLLAAATCASRPDRGGLRLARRRAVDDRQEESGLEDWLRDGAYLAGHMVVRAVHVQAAAPPRLIHVRQAPGPRLVAAAIVRDRLPLLLGGVVCRARGDVVWQYCVAHVSSDSPQQYEGVELRGLPLCRSNLARVASSELRRCNCSVVV